MLGQLVLIGKKVHHRHRNGAENKGQGQGDGRAQERGHAQAAADAFFIALAPVLAHQNAQAALEAEHNAGEEEHRNVGGGHRRHLRVSQAGDHEGVDEPQGKGDEVLQDHGQGELKKPLVKAGFPAEEIEHKSPLSNDSHKI